MELTLIKKHPYATGGVVIFGGLVVFYLLSRSQGEAQAPAQAQGGGMSSADYQAYLQAQAQQAQVNAAAQVQQNALTVQQQQQQLEYQAAHEQTQASLAINDTNTAAQLAATLAQIQAQTQQNADTLTSQTTQQANQLTYAQNIQQMQDDVLMSQINSSVLENANNNATALAGLMDSNDLQGLIARLSASTATTIAGYQADVASKGVDAATQVQMEQLHDQFQLSDKTLELVRAAGLNHGTTSLENALVGTVGTALGYPQVGVAGVQSGAAASIASSQSTANIIQSISGGIASVLTGGTSSLFKKAA
jgi:hypothetical protein